ncbi:hypothetical protein FB390_1497 [Nocardia bhagyanarayanae]|uniref:Uncharacterized protein n=1 Tax=Nocardia bhagyanarayanae TaxID=1215925 RepID=A0A543F7S9_9NOCA|nr:hypothetical protein FB390_1497 [Nocardia bhagyanarayanae]
MVHRVTAAAAPLPPALLVGLEPAAECPAAPRCRHAPSPSRHRRRRCAARAACRPRARRGVPGRTTSSARAEPKPPPLRRPRCLSASSPGGLPGRTTPSARAEPEPPPPPPLRRPRCLSASSPARSAWPHHAVGTRRARAATALRPSPARGVHGNRRESYGGLSILSSHPLTTVESISLSSGSQRVVGGALPHPSAPLSRRTSATTARGTSRGYARARRTRPPATAR